jgi:DNA invertase Pin-like site-specific DNA recombinase
VSGSSAATGRSLALLIGILVDFKRRSVGFQSLTDGIDTGTAGGKHVFHIMGAPAEFKRARNPFRP